MLRAIQSFDELAVLFIQEHVRCAFLDPVMKAASRINDYGLFWLVLCFILLVVRKTRKGGFYQFSCIACEYVACDLIIKNLVSRTRPYLALENIQILVPPEGSMSFPSGHAASSFACAYALAYAFGLRGALAYIPAVLIALSRLYVGVHYPTDVLCGAILGTLVAAVACRILDRIFEALSQRNAGQKIK